MHVVHVQIRVLPESVEAFKQASVANATASLEEPGIRRFDVLQQQDDPCRFQLVEVYLGPEDQARHRLTPHYAAWSQAVAPMMSEPRTALKFTNVFPAEGGW